MRRWINRFLLLSFIAGIFLAGVLFFYARQPMQISGVSYPIDFSIHRGTALKTASEELHQSGVLSHPWAFVLLARLKGQAGEIKAGSYALEQAVTPLELLRKITQGDTILGKLALIEGWTFQDVRRSVAANPALRHDTVNMTDAELLQAVGASETHPEGLFFPDTYFFDKESGQIGILYAASINPTIDQQRLTKPQGYFFMLKYWDTKFLQE